MRRAAQQITRKGPGHDAGEGGMVVVAKVGPQEQKIVRGLHVEALLHLGEWRLGQLQQHRQHQTQQPPVDLDDGERHKAPAPMPAPRHSATLLM